MDELLIKDPENIFCHRARAATLQGLNREKEATVALETLKRMGNLNSEDLIRLGDLYHNLELYEMSFENYKKAIKQNKVLPISRYIRGSGTLIKRGSFENAFYLEKIENEFKSSFSSENEKSVLTSKQKY